MSKGQRQLRPLPGHHERVHSGPDETPSVEAGPATRSRSIPTTRRTGASTSSTPAPAATTASTATRAASRARRCVADPARAARSCKISHPYADPTTAASCSSGPTACSGVERRRRLLRRPLRTRPRSLGTLLGKLLRIDPTAAARAYPARAPGNPLVGKPGPRRDLRLGAAQPLALLVRQLTGNLALADVGDNYGTAREEVDFISPQAAAGANFGWPEYQGFHLNDPNRPAPGAPVDPVFAYKHQGSRCAITGGYVVRDPTLPQLYGRYVWADYCGGRIHSFTPPELVDGVAAPYTRVADDRDEGLYLRYPSSFGEGLAGQIYVASPAAAASTGSTAATPR